MKKRIKKTKRTAKRTIKKKVSAKKGVTRRKTIFTTAQRKSLESRLTKLAKDIISFRKDYNNLLKTLDKM